MKLFTSVGDFFALDIGTTAVRVVQLEGGGNSWSLAKYGVSQVDIKISTSDAREDQKRLGEVITSVIGQSGIRTRNVVLGVPSNKMFATVVELPDMPAQELAGTIKYQAEQYIPMSIDEAKVDYAVLGKSLKDPTKNEVLLASVSNAFSESRLDLVEGLGLNVVAIEPDSVALARSLLPPATPDARLIMEVGDFATDIVMTYADAPRLVRSIPVGMQTLIKAACQNLNIQENQALQFILKFGLQPDRLEGQIFKALELTLDQFIGETVKSLKFFQTRYPSVPVGSMIMSDYGVTIPAFADYLAQKAGIRAQLGNPWQRVHVAQADQVKLQPLSAQFAVAIGLAQRSGV
ncbi:MAG: type IV pilus assembly protein PilM [Candidatus Chaera renei]|uniref:Type IV pilus assembly protein PilM n=1 Tax=Candidatus Chaera renei TaxID=2506947 RepID=A0A4Q0AJC0_9BACT|nr:MAG: type IV pilus assembly protein PilM [Candidatus Chaera renei]